MDTTERAALDEFVAQLRDHYGMTIRLVRLFGSRARGDFDPESDVDVLVVADRRSRRLWDDVVAMETELMLKYDVVISALIMDSREYRWHEEHRAPLYRNVEREGVDLWTNTPAS